MKKVSSKQSENTFKSIVRSVVKEELLPVREELVRVEKRLDKKIDQKFGQSDRNMDYKIDQVRDGVKDEMHGLRDDMLTMKDEIVTELKAVREEQTILSSQHSRMLDLEDKVESLEKIHPHGQHLPA